MKKLTYSSILIALFIWLFILSPSVKASELIFGTNGGIKVKNGSTYYVRIEDDINNLPYTTGIAASGTLNTGTLSMWVSPASAGINVLGGMNYNYLIFDTCSTAGFKINISNNGCNGSCAMSGTYSSISTSTSCSVGGYTGTRRLVQVPIQKWYLNEVAELFEVDSFITFSNDVSWFNQLKIQQVFLSDEDYTITYSNQAELVNKLNAVSTAITNMQNSINTNANTNTQNIINNQNTNTQNIINNQNTNAQNTQNTIKDDSVDSPNTSINTIKGSLASNGVITSLVVLPVTLYQAILNSVNGTCSTFSLGSLFGTNLTIPCINVSNYLGTTLWGSIDVIISGIFIYMISRKMVKVFHQLSSLKEGDVLDG